MILEALQATAGDIAFGIFLAALLLACLSIPAIAWGEKADLKREREDFDYEHHAIGPPPLDKHYGGRGV